MSYRYNILIEYDGTHFIGWQTQPKGRSVQKIVQKTLSKLLGEKITLIGSSRTDSGVHASEQSAHFDTNFQINNLIRFTKSLNFFLNKKLVSVISLKKKDKNFHARFSAKKRIYKYVILNRLSPPSIDKNRVWHIIKKIDIKLIKKGARKLVGTHDFSTFRASNCSAKSPIRTIDNIRVDKKKNIIIIYFKSQSFLQQQVRSMVGCLKYLGEKKWDLEKFKKVLNSKDRSCCAPPAPAKGLFLEKVIY